MITVDPDLASPFTIEEPQWNPDKSCSHCQNIECQIKFDILKRKHHCRRCGRCFCDKCCNSMVALPRMCFIDPVRHCKMCALVSKKESEFFEKQLKILIDGGDFQLHTDFDQDSSDSSILPGKTFSCFLSPDHRYLQFDGEMQENILVQKIESVQVAGVELDQQGNRVGNGICIQYSDCVGKFMILKMNVDKTSSRKEQSMNWVTAMLKAFRLLQESRK
ncbi:unnamed protein product [Candidula unifasciata]|uniref:FYVE-type domain-containing protein n=1 Tax=Candidula unifasciata TaxID=100452 RepID=A0A8S3YHZ8_9EUPU|nr:unnamed protein product [Candidula unifasciata]